MCHQRMGAIWNSIQGFAQRLQQLGTTRDHIRTTSKAHFIISYRDQIVNLLPWYSYPNKIKFITTVAILKRLFLTHNWRSFSFQRNLIFWKLKLDKCCRFMTQSYLGLMHLELVLWWYKAVPVLLGLEDVLMSLFQRIIHTSTHGSFGGWVRGDSFAG